MAGRKTTPLFDLMNRGASATPAPATRERKPVVRVELKPREPSYAPPEAATEQAEHRWPEQWLGISVRAWAVIVVAVGVLLVAAWSLGWTSGKKRAETELQPFVRREPPAVVEPSPDPVIGTYQPRPEPLAPNPVPPSSGGDPRQVGLNYLYLATLPNADAAAAVQFLRQNGVEAYAAVDPGTGRANNPGPGTQSRVFVLPGLSREELSQSKKTNLEAEVVRLGAIWQREHRGTSNFQRYSWEKFK